MIALANNTGMDGRYLLESIGGKDWNGLAKRMEYATSGLIQQVT